MSEVGYLNADGTVSFKGTKYNYLSEEKLTSVLREAFVEAGLVLYPTNMEIIETREIETKYSTALMDTIKVKYILEDIEDGEKREIIALGRGQDSGDKGINKAMTAAFKYAERQAFMIPTGDDPDHISSKELDEQGKIKKNNSNNKSKKQKKNKKKPLTKRQKRIKEIQKLYKEQNYEPDDSTNTMISKEVNSLTDGGKLEDLDDKQFKMVLALIKQHIEAERALSDEV